MRVNFARYAVRFCEHDQASPARFTGERKVAGGSCAPMLSRRKSAPATDEFGCRSHVEK